MHYDHKKVMDWHLLMDLLIEPQWGKGGGEGGSPFARESQQVRKGG